MSELNEPILYLESKILNLESELDFLIKHYTSSLYIVDDVKQKEIKELENRIDTFREAQKAVVHAKTIDKYIRECMMYPYTPQKSLKITRRIMSFIHANARMFTEEPFKSKSKVTKKR